MSGNPTYRELRIILLQLQPTASEAQMRALLAVCLSLLPAPTYPDATVQTFTSTDGVFQFKHPSVLIHCTQKQAQEGWWIPDDDCNSQDGVCDDQGSSGRT